MRRICFMILLLGMVAASTEQITTRVTYYRDVLPILQTHCQSCHRPDQVAPISFLSYNETRPWAEAIKLTVLRREMPPWFLETPFGATPDQFQLKFREIDTILRWVEQGVPAGDPKDAPPPRTDQRARRVSSIMVMPRSHSLSGPYAASGAYRSAAHTSGNPHITSS
jgi:hypothetical protein